MSRPAQKHDNHCHYFMSKKGKFCQEETKRSKFFGVKDFNHFCGKHQKDGLCFIKECTLRYTKGKIKEVQCILVKNYEKNEGLVQNGDGKRYEQQVDALRNCIACGGASSVKVEEDVPMPSSRYISVQKKDPEVERLEKKAQVLQAQVDRLSVEFGTLTVEAADAKQEAADAKQEAAEANQEAAEANKEAAEANKAAAEAWETLNGVSRENTRLSARAALLYDIVRHKREQEEKKKDATAMTTGTPSRARNDPSKQPPAERSRQRSRPRSPPPREETKKEISKRERVRAIPDSFYEHFNVQMVINQENLKKEFINNAHKFPNYFDEEKNKNKKYAYKNKPFNLSIDLGYQNSKQFKEDQEFNANLYWEYIMTEKDQQKFLDEQPFQFDEFLRAIKKPKTDPLGLLPSV